MELSVVSLEPGLIRLACSGEITANHLIGNPDPLGKLLGPDVYGQRIMLGLQQARFIDSAGVGWIVNSHRKFVERGGRLVLYSIPPLIEQTLQLLKVGRLVPLAGEEAAARTLVAAGGRP